jgi:hypothetical protein
MELDLLWSDPMETNGFVRSTRGCGHFWGPDVSFHFCQANNLEFIVRAHQLTMKVLYSLLTSLCSLSSFVSRHTLSMIDHIFPYTVC